MRQIPFLIGTYTDTESLGIHRAMFYPHDGSIGIPNLFYEIEEPKFLVYQKGQILSTIRKDDTAGITLLDINMTQPLIVCRDCVYHDKKTACYITRKDNIIVSAGYHEGTVHIYEFTKGALELRHTFSYGEHAKCHQVFFHKNYLFVVCLGLDEIKILDENAGFQEIDTIRFPKGTGPRQAVHDRTGTFLYVLSELSNEVFTFRNVKNTNYQGVQINTVLPFDAKKENASAAICIHKDGRHLYTTTRGSNIITVFEIERGLLKPVQFIECGGDHPREMKLDPTAGFLLEANRYSHNIVSFRLDTSGLICEQCSEINVPQPCHIEFM